MTTVEIKTIIHESVENIGDGKFLEAINDIVETKRMSNLMCFVLNKNK